MLLQIDSTTALDDSDTGEVVTVANVEYVDHAAQAYGRLLERWKNKPVQNALLASYAAEVQELEQAIWDVIRKRLPGYAGGVNLDVLGALVGEARQGRTDAVYLVWILARIAVNASLGAPDDVINVLQIINAGAFHWRETEGGGAEVVYDVVPDANAATELGAIIGAAREAAMWVRLSFPATATPFLTGSVYGSVTGAGTCASVYGGSAGFGEVSHTEVT